MDGVLHLHITLNKAYERYSAGAKSRPYRLWTPFCRCMVASISLMDAVAQVHGHVPTAYGCRWQAPGGAHGAHGGRRRGGQRRPYRSWTPVGGGRQTSMELRESRAYLWGGGAPAPASVSELAGSAGILPALGTRSVPSVPSGRRAGETPALPAPVPWGRRAGETPALPAPVPWGRRAGEAPLPSPASGAQIQPRAGREAGHETLVASRRKKVGPGLPATRPLYAFTSRQRMRPPLGVGWP
jgi:hypothetical protein